MNTYDKRLKDSKMCITSASYSIHDSCLICVQYARNEDNWRSFSRKYATKIEGLMLFTEKYFPLEDSW